MTKTFNKASTIGFLFISFEDRQEELEAPFSIVRENNFFIVEGINNDQKVTYIIPDSIECFFEIRQDMDTENYILEKSTT